MKINRAVLELLAFGIDSLVAETLQASGWSISKLRQQSDWDLMNLSISSEVRHSLQQDEPQAATIRRTQAVSRGDRGELRIAFTSMIAWTAFPKLIKQYSGEFPNVTLNLTELLPTDLIRSVETGASDVCLAFRADVEYPLSYIPLYSEKLCIALPSGHPLVSQGDLSLQHLKDEAFILTPRAVAPAMHDTVMRICMVAGFDPIVRMHTHLQGTIVNLVAEGLGVSIVPEAMAKFGSQGIVFRPIAESPALEIGIVSNEHNLNPCIKGFLDNINKSSKGQSDRS
ncbi:LysR family substrate-binding domain-containing protein [Pseudomonas syringae]|uniref:LysR family substrate-binding domain-containing protein n=1 Tax=Pseudomonas syringae TaxID=317 RepID=UPI003F85A227